MLQRFWESQESLTGILVAKQGKTMDKDIQRIKFQDAGLTRELAIPFNLIEDDTKYAHVDLAEASSTNCHVCNEHAHKFIMQLLHCTRNAGNRKCSACPARSVYTASHNWCIFVFGTWFSRLAEALPSDNTFKILGLQTRCTGWGSQRWQEHVTQQVHAIKQNLVVFDPGCRFGFEQHSSESVDGWLQGLCATQIDSGRHIMLVDAAYAKHWEADFLQSPLTHRNSLSSDPVCMHAAHGDIGWFSDFLVYLII